MEHQSTCQVAFIRYIHQNLLAGIAKELKEYKRTCDRGTVRFCHILLNVTKTYRPPVTPTTFNALPWFLLIHAGLNSPILSMPYLCSPIASHVLCLTGRLLNWYD